MGTLNEALKAVNLFGHLPAELLDEVVEHGSTRDLGPGRALATQGEKAAGFQLLLNGSAEVYVNDEHVGSLGVGDYFGEMSLLDDLHRSATIVSGPEGVRTFLISPLTFSQLMDRQPQIARMLLKVLAARVHHLEAAHAQHTGPVAAPQ